MCRSASGEVVLNENPLTSFMRRLKNKPEPRALFVRFIDDRLNHRSEPVFTHQPDFIVLT